MPAEARRPTEGSLVLIAIAFNVFFRVELSPLPGGERVILGLGDQDAGLVWARSCQADNLERTQILLKLKSLVVSRGTMLDRRKGLVSATRRGTL